MEFICVTAIQYSLECGWDLKVENETVKLTYAVHVNVLYEQRRMTKFRFSIAHAFHACNPLLTPLYMTKKKRTLNVHITIPTCFNTKVIVRRILYIMEFVTLLLSLKIT